ncbi:hypothetical protein RYX36_009379, partial [Vicia faba]
MFGRGYIFLRTCIPSFPLLTIPLSVFDVFDVEPGELEEASMRSNLIQQIIVIGQ